MHKKGNVNVTKSKSERANTKTNKTPKHSVNNNNSVKPKHLRCNMHYMTQVAPSPTAMLKRASNKKHFARKSKRGFINHVCIVKFLKLLHKLDKLLHNLKFIKSMMTLEILHTKSNMRLTILHVKGVIITLDPNTMKSNSMASSSSPCPSSMEAMIRKSTFHGH